ncbi:hypothetical protein F4775DRAFT_553079 [Biscogniauxia sp. FL1348]|nr:hypothetical protein F4775DRAFT_553079 [Biscogniauxia sp. FL1348]
MASYDVFESNNTRERDYGDPHSAKHPIPTIQNYRQHRKELQGQLDDEEQAQKGPEDESNPRRAYESAKAAFKGEDRPQTRHDPYPTSNHNYAEPPASQQAVPEEEPTEDARDDEPSDDGQQERSATEVAMSSTDPKEKRKAMKKAKRQGAGREVTDPVTHLPITIHDQTEKDLSSVPENNPEPGTHHSTATGPQGASKSDEQLNAERERLQRGHNGMLRLFPPPDFEHTRQELATVYQQAVCAGISVISVLAAVLFIFPGSFSSHASTALPLDKIGWFPRLSTMLRITSFVGLGAATVLGMGKWINKKTTEIFDDETWDAARREEQAVLSNDEELPESVQWLNSLFSAIWPLVNPDLFASLVDQIEDIMQASLPTVIKMVSVDDMGQGSEAIRILGVRWLPTGAASQSVGSDGLPLNYDKAGSTDRTNAQDAQDNATTMGSVDQSADESSKTPKQQEQDQAAIREGMEAEEGDFVNLELALSYRSRSSGRSIKAKSKNAHLYLKFYLPGGVAIPVWVELRGIVMTVRLRLQLTPDPPFISLCTLTFLGQPKASISCVPLSKRGLNLTDVPLISSFVNSAIDAALAEYVAPKSLTLNLKDMLVGEDFKKDTTTRGVVWIFIKRACGFKQGDGGIGPMKGSSDAYVTVSWGKLGKPLAATRVVQDENAPSWDEYVSILVTPEEVNAEEKLRIQLWDSDRWSADDDLGRVELDLKRLMRDSQTFNRIQDREDRLFGQDHDEKMPGSLVWSVGYFSKMRITETQLQQQTVNEDVRTKEQLQQYISDKAEHKLREAGKSSDDEEIRQQKLQDYKEMEDSMIISAPPSDEFVSGVLSIQIHNITGLEVQKLQKRDNGDSGDNEDEAEQSDDMPDSYCTIILNHKKIFRTRTKPKNSKPFFNAGTERFVRDWRDTEIIVSVRDSREREANPLIGIVYLPLAKVFAKKSQVMENYPLIGGIGYGRARISMVWRSIDIKLPPHIRGWDYGTLQVYRISSKAGLPDGIASHRIKVRTNLGRAKIYPQDGQWDTQGQNSQGDVFLAVRKRYSSSLVVEFRESTLGSDRTAAFSVLWLHELVDEENETKSVKVWKGGKDGLRRAQSCCEYNGMSEGEQPLGEIEIELKFWRGLSGYHKGYASQTKNGDMRDVMECLDTITDEGLDEGSIEIDSNDDDDDDDDDSSNKDDTRKKKLRVHTNDDSSASSSDDEDNNDGGPSASSRPSSSSNQLLQDFKKVKNMFRNPVDGATTGAASALAPGHNDPDDGERGLRAQLRDYKDHHKQLHRKHRGVMQWRVAREADHFGGKLSRLKGSIGGIFHHGEKDEAGIETEI